MRSTETAEQLESLDELARKNDVGCLVAPNFALGAVLMMRFAEMAAPFFDTAEVVELHHNRKIDAPSGTAMTTAREMRAARDSDFRRNVAERETLPEAQAASCRDAGTPAKAGSSSAKKPPRWP